MMCPGKEFGITDTIAGVLFAAGTYVLYDGGCPWYFLILPVIMTIGWFAMAAYCFRFAAKCNCQQIYKKLGIK